LDTSRLASITVLPEERLAVVGPGVLKSDLAAALAPYRLCFGPDPASNPSIGGMASTSASGTTTLRYGTTRENVVSALVVTPSGEIIRTRSPVRKSSTGLELNQLYLGSEGTLGVFVELTLRLFPKPAARAGTVLRFESIHAAADAVLAILAAALPTLLRCELLIASCGGDKPRIQLDLPRPRDALHRVRWRHACRCAARRRGVGRNRHSVRLRRRSWAY